MVINKSTSAEGEALLIQFTEPWMFVQKIISCVFDISTETDDLYYYKEFRWSIDGFSFTDFIYVGNSFNNLLSLIPPNDKPFFLEFRMTQVGEGTLVINSLELNIQQNDKEFCVNSQITCCDANSIVQGLVFDNCACNDSFNPYDLGNTFNVYQQLCGVVNNMFGICIGYYRVDPDQKSRDVILKEYSLYNVVQYDTIKIVIPDNQLPSRDIQYNPLMLDFPAQFEVHIVKSSFEQVFGKGSRPMQHDYLYFEQYMNRMYEVDAVAQPDDVMWGSAYWRVSLVPYQKRTAVGYDGTEELKVQTDDIVTSIEDVFKEERENEYKDTRKYNQYNTVGTQSDDYIRTYINKQLKIEHQQLGIGSYIISKYCYDLSSISMQDIAVKYRNGQAFLKNKYGYVNGSFSFFLKPNESSSPKAILNFYGMNEERNVLYAKNPNDKMQLLKYEAIQFGDLLTIDRRTYIVKHCNIQSDIISVTLMDPVFERMKDFIAIKQPRYKNLLQYNKDFDIKLFKNKVMFNLFGNDIVLPVSFEKEKWYAIVVNYNNMANQFSVFVYTFIEKSIKNVYKNTWTIDNIKESKDGEWTLYGNECKFTNFRVWTDPIEEDVQKSVLQQYVVNDTHLTTLVDNAAPELLMQKTK